MSSAEMEAVKATQAKASHAYENSLKFFQHNKELSLQNKAMLLQIGQK